MTRTHWLPCLLLIVPVVAAVASRQPMVADSVASPEPAAPLAFKQYAVNLGEVPPQPAVGAVYEFTNESDHPVTITKLDPSCSCIQPKLDGDATIEPGESSSFNVRMVTANETPGWHLQTVAIMSESAGQTFSQEVSFRVNLPEQKVTLSPKEMYFYQVRGQAGEQVITLTDDRETPVQIERVGIANARGPSALPIAGWVDVELVNDQPGESVIAVRVREGLPSGRRTGWVVVETDDEQQPRLVVPLLLEGRVDLSAISLDGPVSR